MKKRYLSIWLRLIDNKKALRAICTLCKNYTPIVALDLPDGILLDVTGCDHLFGGERKMLESIRQRLEQLGHAVCVGLAPTAGAAWALSHYKSNSIILARDMPHALYALSICALRLGDQTKTSLLDLGIETIKDLVTIPRAQIQKRFGKDTLRRIDEVFGALDDPIMPTREKKRWVITEHLMEPARTSGHLEKALEQMLNRLCLMLQKEALGLTELLVQLLHLDKKKDTFSIGTSLPTYDTQTLMKLLKLKLDSYDARLGIESICIKASRTAPILKNQISLGSSDEIVQTNLSHFMDAVTNKIGSKQIFQVLPNESHVPEKSAHRQGLGGQGPEIGGPRHSSLELESHLSPYDEIPHQSLSQTWSGIRDDGKLSSFAPHHRPIRLFNPPIPVTAIAMLPDYAPARISYKGKTIRIVKADGPERIEEEWWHTDAQQPRDYYKLEDEKGRRIWVFKQGTPPKWFIHGVFA